ncbi:MAG: polymer-forming cytoskeletal protein [Verrucomicrobiota bacterium]
MFKKVIGQDLGDSNRPSPAAPAGYRQPEPLSPPTSHPPAAPASAQASISRPPAGASRNILSSDVEIKGSVKFTNDLIVDGKIEGEISSDGSLTVGENARLKAEIKTATVVVYGKVHGNITALDRIELKSTAEVIGDIKTKTLSIEAGAIFVGKSTVGTPAQTPASAPAPAPAQGAPPAAAQGQQAAKPAAVILPKQGNLPGAI